MIINDILRVKDGFIFKTSEGETSVECLSNIDLSKYKGLEVNNLKDIKKIKNEFVESLVLKCFKEPWKFLDSSSKLVPRTLNVVYSKSQGIKEFLVMSFDTKSVVKSWLVAKEISRGMNKKVDSSYNDEEILAVLENLIRKVSAGLDFSLRIGINVCGSRLYKNKDYVYPDRVLNSEEQYEFLEGLVERFNLCYVEEPFVKRDKKSYTNFVKGFRGKSFVCPGNGVLLDSLAASVLDCKVEGVKILVYRDKLSVHLAVGFGINVIKVWFDEDCIKEIEKIINQIKKS